MLSQPYYVVRSQQSGQYLVAHPSESASDGFLLLFTSDYDALSYVNAHAKSSSPACRVEHMTPSAIRGTLDRWQLCGVGVVEDPLIPRIQFFRLGTSVGG